MPSFEIYKYEERFYIKACKNPALLGKQIISIDEKPIGVVFNQLLVFEERDGNNLTQPTEELLHSFARTYAIEYGNNTQTVLEILDGGEPKEIVLPTIPFGEVTQKTDVLFDSGGVEFSIKDSVALLTVQTFNKEALKKAKYASKLGASFRLIEEQNINHLIIDVRNNGGGHTECVEKLIAYIYGEPFTFYDDVYRSHKDWDTSLIPELSEYPKNISSWAFKEGDDGYFRAIYGSDGMRKKKPKKNNFKGELYVLINGSTLSAAAEFAAFVRQYREATFIGDEAGGNRTQNTSGEWLIIGLPNSKVFALIPFVLWRMNVNFENDGHGIKPDYYIRNSIQEEMDDQDSAMNFTYELIKNATTNDGYK